MTDYFLEIVSLIVVVTLTTSYLWILLYRGKRFLSIQPGDAVVITGAGSGIGKHAALSLAREGYTIFAGVLKVEEGEALIKSAEHFGIDVSLFKILILDVTKSEDIKRAVTTVSDFVGERGLKGLFNNAGGISCISSSENAILSTSVEHAPMSTYRGMFDVNFFGLVEVTKEFLSLIRLGRGRIIMNASVIGFMAFPFMANYSSTKHAVEGFSDSLRREVMPYGVKVSILECGLIATPLLLGFLPSGAEPYIETEQTLWKVFWKAALDAPSPKVSSQAVRHAMRAPQPNLRYVVGNHTPFIKVLRCLPASWVDAFFHYVYFSSPQIVEEELAVLSKKVKAEFEL